MKEGKAAASVLSAAVFRALESIKPENERVLYDPYALQLLSGLPKAILNILFLIWLVSFIVFPGLGLLVYFLYLNPDHRFVSHVRE